MCVCTKVQVSSIIRQGVILLQPSPQNKPLKSPPRLGLNKNVCLPRLTKCRFIFRLSFFNLTEISSFNPLVPVAH